MNNTTYVDLCPRCQHQSCVCPSVDEVPYLPGDEVPTDMLAEYLRRLDEERVDQAVRSFRRGTARR